jgi:hypothetical protein
MAPASGRFILALACVGLSLMLTSACSDDTTSPGQDVVIAGRVYAPSGSTFAGLWAVWRPVGLQADSAPVAADGQFRIEVSAAAAAGELLIHDGVSQTFHPFLYPFQRADLEDIAIVLVPRRWTIQAGIHQGEVVSTSLDPVLEDDVGRVFYTYFFGRPQPFSAPTLYWLDLFTWPVEAWPAKVAFDHRYGSPDFTPADSLAIWEVLNRMEEVFGHDLFEAATAHPDWWPDPVTLADPGLISGVIRVIYEPPFWGGRPLGEEPARVWHQDLGDWGAGGRFTAFQANSQFLNAGVLRVGALEPLTLTDGPVPWPTVLMHEVLHVLGVGHTCRIPSPQGPCVRTSEPSRFDVAYMELLREVMRLEEEHDAFPAIMPAAIGERKLLLGLPALPTLLP